MLDAQSIDNGYQELKIRMRDIHMRTRIAKDAGFPPHRLPTEAADGDKFWTIVREEVEAGIGPTHCDMFRVAAGVYPGNETFRRLVSLCPPDASAADVSAADASAAEPSNATNTGPIVVAWALSNPGATAHIETGMEVRALDEICRRNQRERSLKRLDAARFSDIRTAFLEFNPHILHFSGHATKAGSLILHGDGFEDDEVDRDDFVGLLRILRTIDGSRLRVVFLNACYTWELSPLAKEADVDVIGWTGEVFDFEAIVAVEVFYETYFAKQNTEVAVRLSKQQVAIERKKKIESGDIDVLSHGDRSDVELVMARANGDIVS